MKWGKESWIACSEEDANLTLTIVASAKVFSPLRKLVPLFWKGCPQIQNVLKMFAANPEVLHPLRCLWVSVGEGGRFCISKKAPIQPTPSCPVHLWLADRRCFPAGFWKFLASGTPLDAKNATCVSSKSSQLPPRRDMWLRIPPYCVAPRASLLARTLNCD